MISTRALLHCLVVAIAALPLVGTLSGQVSETFVGAISNTASYAVSGENGYGIARGSLFVVFGEKVGPNQLQYAQTSCRIISSMREMTSGVFRSEEHTSELQSP